MKNAGEIINEAFSYARKLNLNRNFIQGACFRLFKTPIDSNFNSNRKPKTLAEIEKD